MKAYLIFSDAYIDGLAQDCSISIANALEILQSCTKPSIYVLLSFSELIPPVKAVS